MTLQDDSFCFVCGKKNPQGLKLSFQYSNGRIVSEFTPSKIHQGYKDIIHGGIITSVLDEAMIQAAISEGMIPLTAEITVRFKKPLLANVETIVEAEITKKGSRLTEAASRLLKKDTGDIIAEASAKMVLSR
jgi:acyl-coenzyme A thioesterase PaaI-like protein